jgi:hypothetical protein
MSGLLQTAVLSVVFLVALRMASSRPAWAKRLGVLTFMATVADLAVAQKDLVLYAPADAWQTSEKVLTQLPEGVRGSRVYRQVGLMPSSWQRACSQERFTDVVRWDRETLNPKYPLPERISLLEASQTIDSADYRALVDVARTNGLIDPSILDLLGAQVAIVARSAAAPAAQSEDLAEGVVGAVRPNSLPRAWIVHRVEVLQALGGRSPGRLRQRTEDVLFPNGRRRDWRREAVVEMNEPISPGPRSEGLLPQESCRVVYAEPARVEIEAELAADGLVVLADLFYPGWELTVETNGESRKLPILRANRAMRGALLPPGKHRLVYRYRPRSVLYGAATSVLAIVALLGLAAYAGLRRWANRDGPPR